MVMLANSNGADKAVYLAQISTIFGLWMQAPGGEKESDSKSNSESNISEVESIKESETKTTEENHE